jgi:hypothetical protein
VGNQEEKTFTILKLTQRNYNGLMARVNSELSLRECWEANINAEVVVGDGALLKIAGNGRITLKIPQECGRNDIELKYVLYVPELQGNLISQDDHIPSSLSVKALLCNDAGYHHRGQHQGSL